MLFDFDGVLTTDAAGSESTCQYLSERTGLEYSLLLTTYRKYNQDLLYGRCTHADIWDSFCEQINMSIRQDILYDAFISTPIDLEMVNLVSRVRRCGYRTGMVTDNKVDRIGSIIEHHHWKTLFDVVTVSAEVGSRKAEEAIFLKTLMELGLEAGECVFIDNNHANLAVPTKMGMKTVHFDDKERSMPMLKNALHGMGFNL